jgi:hypothetical protein
MKMTLQLQNKIALHYELRSTNKKGNYEIIRSEHRTTEVMAYQ